MPEPRKTLLRVNYNGRKLNSKINDYVESYTYTDVASGESDSISVSLHNIDMKWLNEYMPNKGDSITTDIILRNWTGNEKTKTFKCGSFTIDDVSLSGRPLSCSIGAGSAPANEDFKTTKKAKTWKNTNIKEIASKIAGSAGIALHYEAGTIPISEVEQDEADSSFLYSLCEKYGLAMKVYNNKLIIFDEERYEAKPNVAKISEKDIIGSWSYNTTLLGYYTGAKISYTDPDNSNTYSVEVGTKGRVYEFNSQVDNKYDAELQATAKMKKANKSVTTMNIKIVANTAIIASSVIEIVGLGKINGRYYVDKVKHSVGSSGYYMNLSLHKIQTKVTTPSASAAANAVNNASRTYTIKAGDTLWGIAKTYYGNSNIWNNINRIIAANIEVLDADARKYGHANSENGYWIFPGTVLVIP